MVKYTLKISLLLVLLFLIQNLLSNEQKIKSHLNKQNLGIYGKSSTFIDTDGQGYEFVTKWGSEGSGDGQFDYPRGIAVDNSGYVFVADTMNNRIQKFTTDGTYVAKWGSYGSSDGRFSYLRGIAVDNSGYVFVADRGNHRIQKFTSNGTFITKWGSEGSGDGQFSYPNGIAVDSLGYVYVVDSSNDRIQKFTSNGTFITKWGSEGSGDGQFNSPYGIAVDSSSYVYVSENSGYHTNNRIQKFTSDGTFVTKWGHLGYGNGKFKWAHLIAVDNSGYVFVADYGNHRIQKFTSNGTFITKWGSEGSGDGQFSFLNGVAVDSSGYVYVADTLNYRIQKFGPSGGQDPNISSISPLSGPIGTSVAISGSNFGASQGTVTFNGVNAAITSWANTQIVTTVPSGASTGPVVVHTSDGKDSNEVTFTVTHIISGTVSVASSSKKMGTAAGLSDVVISGLPSNPTTDAAGNYSTTVENGWSGTGTPTKAGYTFSPSNRSYTNVTSDQLDQNYAATLITHTITTPNTPSGESSGVTNTSYTYSTEGSSCSQGHSVEYRFDWGDGSYSDWSSSTSGSHSWSSAGTYTVKAQARCSVTISIVSDWSSGKSVTISAPQAEIWRSPSSMSFVATEGGTNPSSQMLQIRNSGGGTLSYSITDDAGWLSVSPTSGTSTGSTNDHTVSVDITGMSAGTYNATITITASGASNSPQTGAVTLTINPADHTLTTLNTPSGESSGDVDLRLLLILDAMIREMV